MRDNHPLCIAVVTGAHGVHGSVRLKSFAQDPLAITQYKTVKTGTDAVFTLKNARLHKEDYIIVKFKEITNRDQAEALKGTEFFIQRSDLPDLEGEEFYHADLLGLRVQDPGGQFIGTLSALYNFGAGDLLEIKTQKGSSPLMVPFTKSYVPQINIEDGYVCVELSSLLSEEEEKKLRGSV